MSDTTYLTAAEAAAYLRLPSVPSLHTFLWRRRRAGIPVTTYRRNGRLLFIESDLDAALTVERQRSALRKVSA